MRESLGEILVDEGYEVTQAANGKVALELLATSPVDVVILDLAMPLVDGVEVLAEIDPPPPIVIVCSAFAHFEEDAVRAKVGTKVSRILRKPVHPSDLLMAVAEALADVGEE